MLFKDINRTTSCFVTMSGPHPSARKTPSGGILSQAVWLVATLSLLSVTALNPGAAKSPATPAGASIRIPQIRTEQNPRPEVSYHDIPNAGLSSHHAANLTLSNEGTPLVFWFGGSREGSTDVRILRSEFRDGEWGAAEAVLTPGIASRLAGRWVRKLGNPVTWRAPDGALHLYVVTVCLGGWSGSRLLHLTSEDDGRTFARASVQVVAPFFNFSTLVKSPVVMIGGAPTLPAYHEFIRKRPLLLTLDGNGDLCSARGFGNTNSLLQPAVIRTAGGDFLAVHRRDTGGVARVFEQTSENGVTWSADQAIPLPNPGSALALTIDSEGRAVIAFNDAEDSRKVLRLASRDASGKWIRFGPVITATEEVSYPTLLAGRDALHLAYTSDRKKIVHCRVPYELTDRAEVATANVAP